MSFPEKTRQREENLEDIVISEAKESENRNDKLATAAYFLLQSKIVNDEKKADYCLSRAYIFLAIFCKSKGLYDEAAKFYELASELISRDASKARSALLQLANSLNCKAIASMSEKNFSVACEFFEQAANSFEKLGKSNEVLYCQAKKLEAQSREFDNIQDYKKASELLSKAAELMSRTNERLSQSYQAYSIMCSAKLLKKEENYEKAIEYFEEASEKLKQIGDSMEEAVCRAGAMECKAFLLKSDASKDYTEIADTFWKAHEIYKKAGLMSYALTCQIDAYKYFGLGVKSKGSRKEAEDFFTKAKTCAYEMLQRSTSLRAKEFFRSGVLWCEGTATATRAESLLLENIQKRQKMNDVIRLLARGSSILSKSGDNRQAEFVSSLIHFAMAIDAFHDGDIPKANSFVQEARSSLPQKFLQSITESDITDGWEPLRYALSMLEGFENYRRKLETEKGYSFESRVRELLRKMYTFYDNIEDKIFPPEEDEIGIVFADNRPVELDALGTHQKDDNLLLLVGEVKNLSKPVPFDEASKFLKKVHFVQRRYTKIASLLSIKKVEIDNKVFVSKSLLMPNAKDLLTKNNVNVIEGKSVDTLFKKYHLFSLPK